MLEHGWRRAAGCIISLKRLALMFMPRTAIGSTGPEKSDRQGDRAQDCDVSSGTGAGVQAEGGWLALLRCAVHGCRNHGVALFGDAAGGPSAADHQLLKILYTLVIFEIAWHLCCLGLCAFSPAEGSAQCKELCPS